VNYLCKRWDRHWWVFPALSSTICVLRGSTFSTGGLRRPDWRAHLFRLSSVVIPALLFDDLTLQRPAGDVPNLPFKKHPFFDK
jgi:hypothetical protein